MPFESKPKAGSATARTVPSDATESTKTTDEPHVAAAPPPTASPSVAQAEVSDETPKPVVSTPPQAPVAAVTTAISSAVSAVLNPFAGNSPTPPVESPLPWMMMAAARQEFGRTPTLNKAVDPVTTSADVEPVANVTALAAAEAPTPVVAIPQTAPLEVLQHLPIIGPAFVTPIVAFIHQIPLIGDILHPFIGYPVQFGLAPGTPVPRDVKVISFDGTPMDGQTHTVSVPMEMVAQTLKPGESVTLQLVASAFPYETITTWGVLTVSSMTLSLPTANVAAISTPSAAEMVA